MATSIERNNMDLRAESNSGNCFDETEAFKPDSEGSVLRKLSSRKRRILYDREFLIKCFHSPASTRKPKGFPIPYLDCTLSSSKVKRLPFTAQPAAPYQLKRKEEGAKRDTEGDDNISLRPRSGNFSAGCGQHQQQQMVSPSHLTTNNSFSRLHSHEDASKGFDRDFHRNNFRYGRDRRDTNDRNRMDRDRDLDRDPRDRMNRDRLSGSNHRNSNSWSNDGPDSSDWSRRRNGAHFPRERDFNMGPGKRYSDRGRDFDEKEPEWFSGGPSSQHETIELRGFLDDDRREKSDDRKNGVAKEEQNGEVDSSGESTKNDNACESPMDLSIERILKMDHIPGILSNDLLETEEPSGSSRFSQFFKRNSTTPDPGQGRAAHGDPHENNAHSTEDKSKAVHEMGELLRNMLIKKSGASEQSPEPKVKDAASAKPPPATKDDVDAFKKLVTPLLEKVLQGPATQKKAQPQPGKSPSIEDGQQVGNVLDIFKQAPQKTQPQPVPISEGPSRHNSLQDIFNNMMNKPALPPSQMDNVPRMTPNQILQLIPHELVHLVMNLNITQWDFVQLVNIAKSNEWNFRHVLDQFVMQQCQPQQHMVYTGILHLLINGKLSLPGVIVVEPPVSHVVPHMPQPMPNHRAPNFDKFMPRPSEDPPKDMTKRSATPVSSMAFTPTSVMRKMTADGGKTHPPQNPSGFVPVPISGGLLPTPPTTAPVMMNSNSPNLASLMSNMGRPIPHMQFRPPPPPMGYPANPGFHPSMMPPNMHGPVHGPVMLPPPFQNMIPNQPIYNKSDEN